MPITLGISHLHGVKHTLLQEKHKHARQGSNTESDFSALQSTTSDTSFSSQSVFSSSSLGQSPPPSAELVSGPAPNPVSDVHTHGAPLQRSPMQRLTSPNDYFSPDASLFAGIVPPARDVHVRGEPRRMASDPTTIPTSLTATSSSSPPLGQPVPSTSARPKGARSGCLSSPARPSTAPVFDQGESTSSLHPHSFRIPQLKRSWTIQKPKVSRSVTAPEPPFTLHSYPTMPPMSRPSSTASIKNLCAKKKVDEKTLRKSLSSPDSGCEFAVFIIHVGVFFDYLCSI